MAAPFYVLQARRADGVAEAEVGTFVAAQMLGALACSPLWGWWGDRRGKLALLKALGATSVISPALAIFLPGVSGLFPRVTLALYAIVFFGLGAVAGGRIIADLGYLLEISPDERRPEYSGYMSVLVAPSRLLPLVAGTLVTVLSFHALFTLAAAAAVVRLGVLSRLGRVPLTPAGPEPGAGGPP